MKQQTSTVAGHLLLEFEWEKRSSQYFFNSSFILGASFYFFLEKLHHPPMNKKVFPTDLNFSTLPDISWIFPYI